MTLWKRTIVALNSHLNTLHRPLTERTREMVLDGMKKVQQSFLDHDLVANVRLETYEGERYFHVPPTAEK